MAKDKVLRVTIAFSAPPPKEFKDGPVDTALLGDGNFQWTRYGIHASREVDGPDKYYVMQMDLKADGSPAGTATNPSAVVYDSDEMGRLPKDRTPSESVEPSEVLKALPKLFKGAKPNLFPDEPTIYINSNEKDSKKKYTADEFRRNFDNESYVVVGTKGETKENPFGEPVGISVPEESKEEKKASDWDFYRSVVRLAKNKVGDAFSGGFDIMQQFQKKELEKQRKKNKKSDGKKTKGEHPDPEYYSSGFDILRKWQRQHGARPENKSHL